MKWPSQQEPKKSANTPARGGLPDGRNAGNQMSMPPRRMWLIFLAVLLVNYFLARYLSGGGADAPITVPYTVFKEEVAKGNVTAI